MDGRGSRCRRKPFVGDPESLQQAILLAEAGVADFDEYRQMDPALADALAVQLVEQLNKRGEASADQFEALAKLISAGFLGLQNGLQNLAQAIASRPTL